MTMMKPYFYRLVLGLIAVAMSTAAMAKGDIFWPIGTGLEAQIAPSGRLARVTADGQIVIGSGQIFLLKANKGGTIYQGPGFVVDDEVRIQRSNTEVTASGTLLETPSDKTSKVADYTIVYRKAGEGTLNIQVEITLLKDSQWQASPRFSLNFPPSKFTGAALAIVDSSGTERTYTISNEPDKYEGYGFQTATITSDQRQIRIDPAKGTALHIQDTRTWGGDYIGVNLSQREKWKKPFTYSAGDKLAFEVNVVMTEAGQ